MKAGRIILVLMATFVLIVLATSAYVTAYVTLGEYTDWRINPLDGPTNQVERFYGNRLWCKSFFAPAAAVESKWIGCPVYLTYRRAPPLEVFDIDL